MKKSILTLAIAAILCGASAPIATATTTATATESAAAAYTVTLISWSAHARTTAKATVEETADGLMVNYHGQIYKARPSDRDGYKYMIYANRTWYFNL